VPLEESEGLPGLPVAPAAIFAPADASTPQFQQDETQHPASYELKKARKSPKSVPGTPSMSPHASDAS
jgi:hypothetical protein